jgi:hypothetical protein
MKYFLIFLFFCVSCNVQKQAVRHIQKAERLAPEKLAEYCSKNFPPIIKVSDTFIEIKIDSIEIECPPVQKPEWILKVDSTGTISKEGVITYKKSIKRGIIRVDTMPTKIKIATQSVTKYVTRYVTDSALIRKYQIEKDNAILKNENLHIKIDKKNEWLKWVLIILSVSLLLNILFITNK